MDRAIERAADQLVTWMDRKGRELLAAGMTEDQAAEALRALLLEGLGGGRS